MILFTGIQTEISRFIEISFPDHSDICSVLQLVFAIDCKIRKNQKNKILVILGDGGN